MTGPSTYQTPSEPRTLADIRFWCAVWSIYPVPYLFRYSYPQVTAFGYADEQGLRMNPLRLARRFAAVGVLVSILFFSFWGLDYKFNFFHSPTANYVSARNYKPPASRALVQSLNFVFCPPLVMMVVGMDLGASANLLLALVVVVMNGAWYFTLGLLFGLLWDKFSQRSRQNQDKLHLHR